MWGPDATAQPSESLEQWDDNAASRSRPRKSQEEFRKYSADEAAKKSIWEAALQTSEAIAATAIRVEWCRPGLSTTWGKCCASMGSRSGRRWGTLSRWAAPGRTNCVFGIFVRQSRQPRS